MDSEKRFVEISEKKAASGDSRPEENVVSVWHGSGNTSWFRRRWFEGYTQYETLEEDGRKVMHNVYTGYWYIQELDQRERRQHRIVYILLSLAGEALLLFGCTRVIAANWRWPCGLPAFVGLFSLLWALYGVVNDFIVPQKRTIGDYRASSLSILRGGLVCAVASCLLAVITLVFAVICIADPELHVLGEYVKHMMSLHPDFASPGLHVLTAAAELAAAALAFLEYRMEKKVKYTKKQSELAGKYTM